ncbi:MAG: 5-bromo-4-chloroindolyl phosphate hydrolysis family protein [Firmicutes bacterium]|nr:5-bromo-4-chloroindolyl phosphate hydrolysis family protein [Bacillota bacterium]
MSKEMTSKEQIKVLPAGLPFIAAGAVWFVLALILPIYKLYAIILTAAIAAAAFIFLTAKRRQQLAKLPPAPPVKVRAEEMSKKIDLCRETLLNQQKQIKNTAVSSSVGSIAGTMDLIADELERDPKDRNKVRKLANHYTSMITGLVDKYIQLESQSTEGENIRNSMERIEEGLSGADEALKRILDDMFSDDAMEVSADITVLEQLLKTEGSENKMDFSGLDK